MLNRFLLLTASAVMALTLTACGDNAEKKVETKAADEIQQPAVVVPETNSVTNTNDQSANTPAEEQQAQDAAANNMNNDDLSAAAINTANQTAATEAPANDQTAAANSAEQPA